jgi:hypothetical protein
MTYTSNTFQSAEQYEFVNTFLNILYGKLPSYCYYNMDDDLSNFWDNLNIKDYEIIEDFLLLNNYIHNIIIGKSKENVLNFIKTID